MQGVDQALIRSPLLCEAETASAASAMAVIWRVAQDVNIGEAVGVIAAQSIGEPGTQLTMRTFHVGGAAQRGAEQSNIEAAIGGKVKLENESLVKDKSTATSIVMSRHTELLIVDEQGRERERHRLPYGGKLLVLPEGEEVAAGWRCADRMGSVHHADHRRDAGYRQLCRSDRRRVGSRSD